MYKKEKELVTGFVGTFCAPSPQTLTYVQYSVPNCEIGVPNLTDPKRGMVGVGCLALFPLAQFSCKLQQRQVMTGHGNIDTLQAELGWRVYKNVIAHCSNS